VNEVLLVLKVYRAQLDHRGHRESKAHKVKLAHKANRALKENLEKMEKKVQWVFQEDKDQKVTKVIVEKLVHLDPKEIQDLRVKLQL
jgi:hypothetical protein